MFYDAVQNTHGLAHDPFKAIVAPRPIGWISSLSATGVRNLAPYSFFNAVATNPHLVMFTSSGRKDSVTNAEMTGEFVCSLATYDLREAMNRSSAPVAADIDEFDLAGLTPTPSHFVKPPRVGESPAALECRVASIQKLQNAAGEALDHWMVIGQVMGVYIDEAALTDGFFDVQKVKPLSRLGYLDYAAVEEVFALERPQLS